jgi:hypothetical protein
MRLLYVCIVNREDGVILSQYTTVGTPDVYAAKTSRVLSSPGWASVTTDRLVLDDGPTSMYILLDSIRLYIAITAKDYPSRCIYDTADGRSLGLLHGELQPFLRLCEVVK